MTAFLPSFSLSTTILSSVTIGSHVAITARTTIRAHVRQSHRRAKGLTHSLRT